MTHTDPPHASDMYASPVSDPSAFPYLIRIESRCGPLGRWQRHVECPALPDVYGDGESLVEAFEAMEARYSDRVVEQERGDDTASGVVPSGPAGQKKGRTE